jgi:hypothetical protein
VRGISVIAPLPGASPEEAPRQDFALAASNARAANGRHDANGLASVTARPLGVPG